MKKILLSVLLLSILLPASTLAASLTAPKVITPAASNDEDITIKAYESTLSSVVSIVMSEQIMDLAGGVSQQDTGGGTGFFVSSDGYIITNKHVVSRKDVEYTVITSDNKEYTASVLATDPLFDIAIVKVEGSGFKPAKLGDSDKIKIGQTVLAIGNVLAEFSNTLTKGIISGIGRTITASGNGVTETLEGTIQTDASINPGNSGGPLVNLRGEVVGVNTAIDRSGESLGFAIPINEIKAALSNFKNNGKILRSYLGVRYVMLNRSIAKAYKLNYSQGAYILIKNSAGQPGILPDGPADRGGLLVGDIVLEINGQKLSTSKSLSYVIAKYPPNQQVEIKVLRKGTELKLKMPLGERNTD